VGYVRLEPAGAAYAGPHSNIDTDPLTHTAYPYRNANPNGYCDDYAHAYGYACPA
jgi:hypothetical protein